MSEVLDILLGGTARNVAKDLPEKDFKMLRLSRELGKDVVFKLRALPYSRTAELASMPDMDVMVVLDGVASPDLRDTRLAAKYGVLPEGGQWGDKGATPPDLVKAMFLPGEIKEISTRVQMLSGYQTVTLREVKKN